MHALIEDLLSRGFDAEAARSRAALVASVEEAFRHHVGQEPRWRWWVPGRLEVFGKHTDYAGGRSLVAAVPRGFAVVARERADGVVCVTDAGRGGTVEIDSADPRPASHGWSNYVATVVGRLTANFPGATLGTDIVIASDLPSAAGLSSSSTFIVGLALALVLRGGLAAREEWRQAVVTPQDLAGYLGAIEAGASFGQLAGAGGVGTHGGSEDHTAILTCRPGMVSQNRFVPVRHLGDVPMPGAWSCAIATSGVHADKTGGARDRFNRAADATRAIVDVWNRATGDEAASLAAALASASGARARLESALHEVAAPGFSAEDLSRRLTHFLREDDRVPTAANAFAAADARAIERLSRESQRDAETLLGNQVPETVELVAAARAAGAFAASSFGAGFGGSVWAIVPAEDVARFGPAWVDRYRARVPHIGRVEWFVAEPAPPVVELSPARPGGTMG